MDQSKIDFNQLKAQTIPHIHSCAERWAPGGKLEGTEYSSKNPTRADSHPGSFKINIQTGSWSDFAEGAQGGDLVSYYHYIFKSENHYKAAEAVQAELNLSSNIVPFKQPVKDETWKQLIPVPSDAYRPYDKHKTLGQPARTWHYKDINGNTLGYIYRFNTKDGKQIFPLTYRENLETGKRVWKWKGFDKPRPLYGLEFLKHSKEGVLLVEGEKAADAAREMLSKDMLVFAWVGGTKGIPYVDFTPIYGKKIIIWPDNDLVGLEAALKLNNLLKPHCKVRIIINHIKAPKGWDIADGVQKGWSRERTLDFIKVAMVNPKKDEDKIIAYRRRLEGPASIEPQQIEKYNGIEYPFRCLGYHNNVYYYLPEGSQQILRLAGNQHDETHISAFLAPITFWENHWAGTKNVKTQEGEWEQIPTGPDWKGIKHHLIWNMQNPIGVYQGDDSIRGTGVWRDNNRIVIHFGDKLRVNNVDTEIAKIESHYIYEKKRAVETENTEPLNDDESKRLFYIVGKFSWAREISTELVCGWIVASMIGGALPWRPHIWLNGPQGCGKSTVLKDIIRRILGSCVAIFIEGATTEAGLRQHANHCSFPILFDEAESNDKKGQLRMEQIIELMRSSASPDGGKLVKGTPGGSPLSFDVQSCFCLASVSSNSTLSADMARIINLEMVSNRASESEKWEILSRQIQETFNPDWCAAFRQRVFKMVPQIRINIEVFIKAVRNEMDSQRVGDVYGVLLGSGYSMKNSGTVTPDEATALVKQCDWSEEKTIKEDKDEIRCLQTIMQKIITIRGKTTYDKSIWELIEIVHDYRKIDVKFDFSTEETGTPHTPECIEAARRYGVIHFREDEQDFIIVQNNNVYLENWLKDGSFYPKYNQWLKRIKETIGGQEFKAEPAKPRRFDKEGSSSRGIKIPYEIVKHYCQSYVPTEKKNENEKQETF